MTSSVDFDFHAGVKEVIMSVGLTVLAHDALALLSTLHSRPETVAVIFAALGFLAGASSLRNKCRNSFEGSRVPEIS